MYSPIGRGKTLPEGDVSQVKLAVFSCSNYPAGYFHVYAAAALINGLDASIHLGDYIYEYGAGGYASEDAQAMGRVVQPATEILTLADYRQRYAQYRTDQALQQIHAAAPFIAVWDDHEITNDAWRDGAENHQSDEGDYTERKMAALRAYFEWMPIRPVATGDNETIYRQFEFGNLLNLLMLDTRIIGRDQQLQYASYIDPTSGQLDAQRFTADLTQSSRTILGAEQLQWLQDKLSQSTARWQMLGQQVLMGRMMLPGAVALQQLSITDFAELAALAQLAGRAQAGDSRETGSASHRGNNAAKRASLVGNACNQSHDRPRFGFSGSLLDAGRVARIASGLDQLMHTGLGIIEGDNRFAWFEGNVNFINAFNPGNRHFDGDRAGGAGHARYGQRDGLGGGPHGGNNGSEGEGGKQFFHDELL